MFNPWQQIGFSTAHQPGLRAELITLAAWCWNYHSGASCSLLVVTQEVHTWWDHCNWTRASYWCDDKVESGFETGKEQKLTAPYREVEPLESDGNSGQQGGEEGQHSHLVKSDLNVSPAKM